jgi:4-amino-4-deoxy-L-arabinose transferase-like glycosyltransferase
MTTGPETSPGGETKTGGEHADFLRLARICLILLTTASLAGYAYHAWALFLKYPPVWPDEPVYAQPADNLIHHGKMSTPLMDMLPGMTERTYWMPPLYFLYLCPFFAAFGTGIVVMRLSSVFAAVAGLVLLYAIGRRAGLGKFLAMFPPAVMAVDHVFLSGSLIGRMEMLTLALVLVTLWQWLNRSPSWIRSFLCGLTAGLAALSHPMGMMAPLAVLAGELIFPHGPRRRNLLAMIGGCLLVGLAWGAYILQDTASFIAQFSPMLARKAGRHMPLEERLSTNLVLRYGKDCAFAAVFWILGFAGLVVAAIKRKELWTVVVLQVVSFALISWSVEIWYPVYMIPLSCLGVAFLLDFSQKLFDSRYGGLAITMALVVVIVVGWFAWENLSNIRRIDRSRNGQFAAGTDYAEFCRQISDALPDGSRVILSSIPDPYFGLAGRKDLKLQEFPAIPIDREKYQKNIESYDYVVTGKGISNEQLREFVSGHGEVIKVIRLGVNGGYEGRVVRIVKPDF